MPWVTLLVVGAVSSDVRAESLSGMNPKLVTVNMFVVECILRCWGDSIRGKDESVGGGADLMGVMFGSVGDGSEPNHGRCYSVGGRSDFTVGRVHTWILWLNP